MQPLPKSRKGLPAVVAIGTTPSWISCRSISSNLKKAYELAFGDHQNFFAIGNGWSHWKILSLAKTIARTRPSRVIFLDHPPHPGALILELIKLYGGVNVPPICIHVYGDITLFTPEWHGLSQVLKDLDIQFLCASDRQRQLVSGLLRQPKKSTAIKCPFPVDGDFFKFDEQIRAKTRAKYSAAPDERVCLYSGRISLQKNIIQLTRYFLNATASGPFKCRLLIAGFFDDIGAPLFGIRQSHGEHFQQWLSFYKSLREDERLRVLYVGNLRRDDLLAIYNASDIGLSLSLYHDEDYGMAPIEALFTGSRMILSSWGGYASFQDPEAFCTTVDVRVPDTDTGNAEIISQKSFTTQLHRHLSAALDPVARIQSAARFDMRFSIPVVSQVIQQIHQRKPPPFGGFSQKMRRHAEATKASRQSGIPVFPQGMKPGSLYHDIYGPYFRKELTK